MEKLMIVSIVMQAVVLVAVLILCVKYSRLRHQKENEYYTDYRHNNLTLRVYKPEFEYQAIGSINRGKILESGTLSPYYNWALLQL